jgi:hypothetical protein
MLRQNENVVCKDLLPMMIESPASKTAQGLAWLCATALLMGGCTAAHYRHSADKEVYAIVQQVEGQIFGHTNAFAIDTPYSTRKPGQIPFE